MTITDFTSSHGFFGDETDEEFLIRLKMFMKSLKLVHHRVREDIPWLPPVYPTPPLLQVSVPYLYNAVPPVPQQPPGLPKQPPGVPQTSPGSYKS
ncbi:unnamed protein product [Allacma fusca]|uniref:Uncharacterized protein n=1 Tax=Allacma fusca TaxID=39272 RepID=A0A8J2NVF6_9HEXA|nr:unnamed protein product [Allacma fusca]